MKTLLNLLNRTANAVKISGGGSSRTTKHLFAIVTLLLTFGVGNAWGENTKHPIYCAIKSSSLGEGYLDINVHKGGTYDGGVWYRTRMTKIATTITKAETNETKDLYYAEIEYVEAGLQELQFEIWDGDESTDSNKREFKTAFSSWWTSDGYTKPIFDYENGNFTTYPASLTQKKSYVYFDAADWNDDVKQLVISHGTYRGFNDLNHLSNTTLYYANPDLNWGDAVCISFIGNSTSWSETGKWLNDIPLWSTHYTGYLHYSLSENSFNYFARRSGDEKGAALSYNYWGTESTAYQNLNKTQTVQARVKATGSSYSDASFASWPGSVSVERTYMSSASAVLTPSAANMTSATTDAVLTSSITLTASANSGYYFEGWGDASNSNPTDGTAAKTYKITDAKTSYAFFSQTYTLTYERKGDYSTSTVTCFSVADFSGTTTSGSSIPTGHMITLVATPATGYEVEGWYSDASCETAYTDGSGGVTIEEGNNTFKLASLNANTEVYCKFRPISYIVTLQGMEADDNDPIEVNVTYNAELSSPVSGHTKEHYDFRGYWTDNNDAGATLVTQLIDDNYNWKKNISPYTSNDEIPKWIYPNGKSLFAKWAEKSHDVSVTIFPAGAGSVQISSLDVTEVTAGEVTWSSVLTPIAKPGWKFKEWQKTSSVDFDLEHYHSDYQTSGTNSMAIKAYADGQTLTAVFEPRFELVGSTYADSEVKDGMPGWSYDGTGVFEVLSTSPVNLTCTCSLEANTTYKFEIRDRAVSKNYGDGTDGKYELIDGNTAHCFNENMDMKFQTTGAAKYVFQINEIDGSDHPYVKLLWPRQVNFGWKYKDADAPLNEGGGGTVTAYVHEGGVKTAVSTGDYMIQGATISFTAHPYNDYDFAGWWGSYSYEGEPFLTGDSISWSVTSENANAYAKFTEKSNTFTATSGNNWNTTANWSKGHVPTQDEAAIIQSPVEVNVTDAKAKKVLLMQDGGHNGKIDIPAGKELVVRSTIKKTTDGSTYGATGYEDINIGSTLANGTGALVMDANDGTNKATVNFAVKAKKVDGHNVNQFIGTPFNDENNVLYNYYGTKIYRFMAGHDGNLGPDHEWKRVAETGEHMNGFYGYNILTNQTTEPVLWMQGTLNRSAEETITGYYNGSSNTENMFANSWVAPIYIPNFENDDFTNIEKTIYIFNAGTPVDQGEHTMGEGNQNTTAAGQYCVVPVKAAEYTGLKVIPAMQAFSVFATGVSPSLKFNYTRLVYNPSNGTATIVPTRAPRRTATNDPDAPTVLRLAVTGESGYAAKIVLLERTDFSDNFDDGWDGRFMAGDDAAPQLYAVTPDGNMAINSIPNIEGTLLGFKAGEADDVFTFSFDYDGEALYLYDTHLQIYTRVMTGNTYAFTTSDNEAHNRFILTHNAPGVATGIEPVNNPSQVNNKMIIDNHLYIFRGGVLYDALGRMIGNGKEAGL